MSFSVYVLILQDGWLYVGQTQDLEHRLRNHLTVNSGKNNSTEIYIAAHGGIVGAVTLATEIITREEAIEIEEEMTANLAKRGYQVTCHPWKPLPT